MAHGDAATTPLNNLRRRLIGKLKKTITKPPENQIDIRGERDIEWSFLSQAIPNGPGLALDFGCEHGYMSLVAAQKGYDVLALDLEEQNLFWQHPKVRFQRGDFLELSFPARSFDLVVNCSSVEHVGIVGRYGIAAERNDGDLDVMRKFASVLKPTGLLAMTAPCGRDAVLAPWCRVYGERRLPQLFETFEVQQQQFWVKNPGNRWVQTHREDALRFQPLHDFVDPHACSYALGCFLLRVSKSGS